MHLEWDHRGDDWTDRSFQAIPENGESVAAFESQPSLEDLRKLERETGELLDLWQAGLIFTECDSVINGRFTANPEGDMLSWD